MKRLSIANVRALAFIMADKAEELVEFLCAFMCSNLFRSTCAILSVLCLVLVNHCAFTDFIARVDRQSQNQSSGCHHESQSNSHDRTHQDCGSLGCCQPVILSDVSGQAAILEQDFYKIEPVILTIVGGFDSALVQPANYLSPFPIPPPTFDVSEIVLSLSIAPNAPPITFI